MNIRRQLADGFQKQTRDTEWSGQEMWTKQACFTRTCMNINQPLAGGHFFSLASNNLQMGKGCCVNEYITSLIVERIDKV